MNIIPVIKLRKEIIQRVQIKTKKLNNVSNVIRYLYGLIEDYYIEPIIVFYANTKMDTSFVSKITQLYLNQ